MRILTVRQPWAGAIIHAGKDVENRQTNIAGGYRGPVAIHAALAEDLGAWDYPVPHPITWAQLPSNEALWAPRGAIVGVVELVDVHAWLGSHCVNPTHVGPYASDEPIICSPWADEHALHLVLANPRPLVEPIPYRGMLGLRQLDDDTVARIEEAIA
ncbi:hypothetical protein [Microbacterium maritypicum]